jgi:antitoxin component YwqK of YwqJK toxin-antitoxin module
VPAYIRFIVFICFFYPLTILGQHKKVQTWYDASKLHLKEEYYVLSQSPNTLDSLYVSFFQNGHISVKGYYLNGKAVGLWEYFYQGGALKMKGLLSNSLSFGLWQFFYENGKISFEGPMFKGKKSGKWTYYYENGERKSQGEYEEDNRIGVWKYYYEDGTYKATATYNKGKGKYTEYFTNGIIKSEGTLVDGQSSGLWKYYYDNGTLKAEGYEKNDLKEGMWKFYHPNGQLASQGGYEQGQSAGNWKYYHDNGVLSSEGEEASGQKNGYWKLYYKNGSFKGDANFQDGEGAYKEYHENGKIKIEGFLKNNKNHGSWKYYYETGELEGKCFFDFGNGNYIGYFPDGKIKMEGRIEDGKKVGIWKLYNEDGSLSGYYRSYYDDETPIMEPVVPEKIDSISPDTIGYKKPDLKLPKKKSRYFTKRINEFNGIIISTNPLAPLFGSVPLSFEYYLQERLGYELGLAWLKNPFFRKANINENAWKGFEVHFRQKFYQKDQDKGMYYFGHELRYTDLNHHVVFIDSSQGTKTNVQLSASEKRYEYSILIGNRLMGDSHRKGYSFDVFIGIGLGYRMVNRGYSNRKDLDNKFDQLKFQKLSLPLRAGLHVGYVLDKKKVYKKLRIW